MSTSLRVKSLKDSMCFQLEVLYCLLNWRNKDLHELLELELEALLELDALKSKTRLVVT